MSRETNLIAKILSDEANAERSAQEVADLCIAALDDYRASLKRYMPVIQVIRPSDGPGEPYLVSPATSYSAALQRASVGLPVIQALGRQGLTVRAMVGTIIGNTREILDDFQPDRPESQGEKLVKWVKARDEERISLIKSLIDQGMTDAEIQKKASASPAWVRRIRANGKS